MLFVYFVIFMIIFLCKKNENDNWLAGGFPVLFLLLLNVFSPSAFCDEDVISQRQEEHEHDSRQEMYSEQRKEMMSKQVTSLHQSKQEQVSSSSTTCVSSEAQEWQQMAKKEKNYTEYSEQSSFNMVSSVNWMFS